MENTRRTPSFVSPRLLCAGFLALAAALPSWQAQAQAPTHTPMSHQAAAQRHAEGLLLDRRGDHEGALVAYLAAAEDGYSPSQRRLGEIYDSGNSAVKRDYEESIRWYQKAREGGEDLPSPPSPMPQRGATP